MSTTYAGAPGATTLARSRHQTHHETLAGLIAAASAALDTDRDTARACIAKAAALLQRGATRERWKDERPAQQRGGLAPWQARRVEEHVANNLGGRIRTTDLAH